MSKERTYSLSQIRRMKGRTDWDRVRKATDAEIERSVAGDADWAGLEDIDWSKAEVVVPANKVAISIRLDPDILDFFKDTGPGYQRRINAVLRSNHGRGAEEDASVEFRVSAHPALAAAIRSWLCLTSARPRTSRHRP
ncbi:MAG: BrnA antitoxin family protein [Bauldia sp.]|nr:BrnA antitoxin family protein [Bauldia sp.]